jgi:SAM-dependent methyltransferase
MAGPTIQFWQEQFEQGRTPWDRGGVNPQLQDWLASGALSRCRILVPGCGSGYEVVALAQAGFDVTGLDYAPGAIARTRNALNACCTQAVLVEADVLAWRPDRPFDAIYEQTCLCALYPDRWRAYADRLWNWLRPHGRLFALFVQYLRPSVADGSIAGPPYHCDINGMRALFHEPQWAWPKPPYPRTTHPAGLEELAVVLQRQD